MYRHRYTLLFSGQIPEIVEFKRYTIRGEATMSDKRNCREGEEKKLRGMKFNGIGGKIRKSNSDSVNFFLFLK